MAEQLKRFIVPLAIAGAGIVLALILLVAWVLPEGSSLASANAQKTQLGTQLTQLQAQISELQKDKALQQKNCAALTQYGQEVPTDGPEEIGFLQALTSLAQQSSDPNTPQVQFGSSGPATPGKPSGSSSSTSSSSATASSSGLQQVQVSLSLAGTLGQMLQFLQGLNHFQRLYTISALNIAGGPVINGPALVDASTPGYTLSLNGEIYFTNSGAAASSLKSVCVS